jgi:hypothetical protein
VRPARKQCLDGQPGFAQGRKPEMGWMIKMVIAKTQLAVLILTGIAIVSPSPGATLKVGPNQTYKAPSAAAAVAKNGDHIEIEPGQYFDCAVWNADDLVIEGTGPGVVITDKTCMGKGLLSLRATTRQCGT